MYTKCNICKHDITWKLHSCSYSTQGFRFYLSIKRLIIAVAEFLIRDLGRVSEWCDLWGMKLNASKTKTMIVSRSLTMHPQSPPLTIGGTVLKESDDLVILEVTFDSKMTFEKHLRSVSRTASQRLGILRKSWRVFHDRSLLGR